MQRTELAFQASQANSQLFLGFQLTLLSLASPIAAAWWNALKTPHTTVSWHAVVATLMFLDGYGAAWFLAIVQMCHVRYRRIEAFAPDKEVCRIAQEEGAARVLGLEQAAARDRAGELVADIVRLRLAARLRKSQRSIAVPTAKGGMHSVSQPSRS